MNRWAIEMLLTYFLYQSYSQMVYGKNVYLLCIYVYIYSNLELVDAKIDCSAQNMTLESFTKALNVSVRNINFVFPNNNNTYRKMFKWTVYYDWIYLMTKVLFVWLILWLITNNNDFF